MLGLPSSELKAHLILHSPHTMRGYAQPLVCLLLGSRVGLLSYHCWECSRKWGATFW